LLPFEQEENTIAIDADNKNKKTSGKFGDNQKTTY
jgi:hypothetical protein